MPQASLRVPCGTRHGLAPGGVYQSCMLPYKTRGLTPCFSPIACGSTIAEPIGCFVSVALSLCLRNLQPPTRSASRDSPLPTVESWRLGVGSCVSTMGVTHHHFHRRPTGRRRVFGLSSADFTQIYDLVVKSSIRRSPLGQRRTHRFLKSTATLRLTETKI